MKASYMEIVKAKDATKDATQKPTPKPTPAPPVSLLSHFENHPKTEPLPVRLPINVVIPMAGLGSRFSAYGFKEEKYLLPLNCSHTKMIEEAVLSLGIDSRIFDATFFFVLREENGTINHALRHLLQDLCNSKNYQCVITSVWELTEGPATTVFTALYEHINNDTPLLISNSDQILDWNFIYFYNCSMDFDGCVLTYTPPYKLILGEKDKHSFVKLDDNGKPIQFIEKEVISDDALVGVHFYKRGEYFIQSYCYMHDNQMRAPNGEFYLSYTYQSMLEIDKYSVGVYRLRENERYYPVGEPMDYFEYVNEKHPPTITPPNDKLHIITSFLNNIFVNTFPEVVKDEWRLRLIITHGGWEFEDSGDDESDEDISEEESSEDLESDEDTETTLFRKEPEETIYIVNREGDNIYEISHFSPNRPPFTNKSAVSVTRYSNERTVNEAYSLDVFISDSIPFQGSFFYYRKSVFVYLVLEGEIIINGIVVKRNQIFVLEPNMICCMKRSMTSDATSASTSASSKTIEGNDDNKKKHKDNTKTLNKNNENTTDVFSMLILACIPANDEDEDDIVFI